MKPATVSKLPQIFQASECFENIGEFTIHYLFQSLLLVTYQMSKLFLNVLRYPCAEHITVIELQIRELAKPKGMGLRHSFNLVKVC